MDIRQVLIDYLQTIKRSTIPLEQLERVFTAQQVEYAVFAEGVLQLEQDGVLQRVKSHGSNGKSPALSYQYRIRRENIQMDHARRLHNVSLGLHPLIQLDAYFGLSEAEWRSDWPYIELIHTYLERQGLPSDDAPAPERSFELAGDEKWITEKGGQALLERISLWGRLRIMPVSDPLMLAINPMMLKTGQQQYRHLIVENKTTYQGLIGVITETGFASLIYGSGRKIVGNLEMHRYQYPVIDGSHLFYYFGDIDFEGIRIWYDLQRRYPEVQLALPFYAACVASNPGIGKENQRRSDEALAAFLRHFPEGISQRIEDLLGSGYYWPQETLARAELESIWRSEIWNHH